MPKQDNQTLILDVLIRAFFYSSTHLGTPQLLFILNRYNQGHKSFRMFKIFDSILQHKEVIINHHSCTSEQETSETYVDNEVIKPGLKVQIKMIKLK